MSQVDVCPLNKLSLLENQMVRSAAVNLLWGLFIISSILCTASCEKKAPEFSCTDPIGCVDIAPGDPLKIGVLQSLSGKVAPLGIEQIRGFELALEKRQGTILGHKVEYSPEDTGCTSEGGANAVLKIIADPQYVAIFGTTCSGAAATAARAMSTAGLAMISGNNSAPFLTSIAGVRAPNWQAGYFRTAANEENAGKAAALYAYNHLHLRKAATINDGDIYTRGLTDGFIKSFQDLGGQVVLDTSINKGDREMQPVLTAVLNAEAELLFFPLFQPEGNLILFQSRQMPEFANVALMSDGALIENSFIDDVKEQGHGMYFVGPATPTGKSIDLLAKKYTKKFNVSPATSYYLTAFDGADLLFEAIEKTGVLERDGRLHIGRQALRDTLYGTRDFKGIAGSLSCDEFGDCGKPVFKILRLDNYNAGIEGLSTNVLFNYAP